MVSARFIGGAAQTQVQQATFRRKKLQRSARLTHGRTDKAAWTEHVQDGYVASGRPSCASAPEQPGIGTCIRGLTLTEDKSRCLACTVVTGATVFDDCNIRLPGGRDTPFVKPV